jgi:hypothetical protein
VAPRARPHGEGALRDLSGVRPPLEVGLPGLFGRGERKHNHRRGRRGKRPRGRPLFELRRGRLGLIHGESVRPVQPAGGLPPHSPCVSARQRVGMVPAVCELLSSRARTGAAAPARDS